MVRGVFLDNNYEKADFKYPAESIMYDFENSPIRTSIASILKNITDPLIEMQETGINNIYAPKEHASKNTTYGVASSKVYGHIKIGDGFIGGTVIPEVVINTIPNLGIFQQSNAAFNRENYGMFVGATSNSSWRLSYVISDPGGNFTDLTTNDMINDTESGQLVGLGDTFIWAGGYSPSNQILICEQQKINRREVNSTKGEPIEAIAAWRWRSLITLPYSGGYKCLVAYDMVNGDKLWEDEHEDKILILNNGYFYWLDYGSSSLREVFSENNYLSCNMYYTAIGFVNRGNGNDLIFVVDTANQKFYYRFPYWTNWTEINISNFSYFEHPTLVIAKVETLFAQGYFLQLCCNNTSLRATCFVHEDGWLSDSWNYYSNDTIDSYNESYYGYTILVKNNIIYRFSYEYDTYNSNFNLISVEYPIDPIPPSAPTNWGKGSLLIAPETIPPAPKTLEIDSDKVFVNNDIKRGPHIIRSPLYDIREPLPHASLLKIYGLSTVDLYGHARLVDDYSHIVFEKTSGATTITEMPFCIWQRNNTAINQDGVLLATGELTRNNNEFVYSLFNESGLTDPTVSRISSFRNGEIVGFGDGFLWFGGFRDPYALWFYNPKTSTWHRLPDLPFSFENGQVSQNNPEWLFDEYSDDNVYVMFFDNSNNCYTFGRISYSEMSQGVVATGINALYLNPEASPNNLAFAATPSYLVVLDTTRDHHIMYKNSYSGNWGTASHNLPFLYEKQINNPTAMVYEEYNRGAILHVMGPIDNGHFIHKVFDLYRNWSEPADASALPYISDYGYSMCLKGNKLYLFIPNSNETTEIYCCDADTMNPVWQKTYLSVIQSGFHEISDLAIWQRSNVAINSDNEMMLIGGSTWTPHDYIYDNHKIIINDTLSNLIPDFDSGNVIGWQDKFLWFGGYETQDALCIGSKDPETNQWVWDWDNNNPLPYEFYTDNIGSVAKITFTTSRSEQEQILIMLCDPNISYDDMYGYKFYWYDHWGDFYPAFYYNDEADPTSYQDNVFYTQTNSQYLTLVLTPAYIVILDTNNKQMWKHSWDYYGSWRQANNSLPFAKTLYYPSTICYGNDFYYDSSSGPSYLHVMGTIYNGHFFHKVFDLYNMEWGDPANCDALPWICCNNSGSDNYCYNGGYSVILKGNKIYLFTTGDGENYDAQGTTPTRIYSCQADTISPVWQEDFLPTDPNEGDQGGSEKVGGNGMVASSFAVTTFRKDIDTEIDQIMDEDDFHAELDRRLTEYLKDIHSQ